MIVYRTLTGRPLFSGIFNAKASKSKNEDKPPAKGNGIRYRVKFTVAVKKGSAYAIEWCLASFNSVADRDQFTKIYTEAASGSPKKETQALEEKKSEESKPAPIIFKATEPEAIVPDVIKTVQAESPKVFN